MTDLPSTDLSALLERVEKATGADRELDAWVQVLVDNHGRLGTYRSATQWVKTALDEGWNIRHYTASLDAALGLVGRALPGCLVALNDLPRGNPAGAAVASLRASTIEVDTAYGKSRPLAVIASLLSALIASEGGSGPEAQ